MFDNGRDIEQGLLTSTKGYSTTMEINGTFLSVLIFKRQNGIQLNARPVKYTASFKGIQSVLQPGFNSVYTVLATNIFGRWVT